jgi:hypothetical protein
MLACPWIEVIAKSFEREFINRSIQPEPGRTFATPQADQFLSFAIVIRRRVITLGVLGTVLLRDANHP